MIDEEQISDVAKIIKESNYIVVFTGAGISTESGIDDFRSEGGLWSRYDPAIYASYYYFLDDPSKFWEMHNELEGLVANAKPNPAHYAIATLEKLGKVKAIITQNVDMLHQKAGSGSYGAKIYELHGQYGTLECIKCKKEFHYEEIDTKSVKFPVCKCSGYIKPKVVLFGESLPMGIMEGAMNACRDCDCFLMVGSSLVVSPANFMPSIAKQSGARLIFINRESTIMDDLADIFLRGSASEMFTALMKKL
ncbi:MAG: NAD-dependent deacylase [Promethearchaeota archaeon]|nr:MAG: NAD-dependent deacylase [Candidatus Lokiarchaeota archaeon]